MPGLEMLDVLIGLTTTYLLFGMACTAITEAISAWFEVRSGNLEAALKEFFSGELRAAASFPDAFYRHPIIQALSKGDKGRPSYIPPEIVGQVVESLITANGTERSILQAVDSLPGTRENNRIKGLLATLAEETGDNGDAFRKAVETHFDAAMDRASGWFKRYTQNVALAVSLVLVVAANVDAIALASSLAANPAARLKMVEIADQRLQAAKTVEKDVTEGGGTGAVTLEQARQLSSVAATTLDNTIADMQAAGLRFGWQGCPKSPGEMASKIVGLIISIFAVSLGAPFWFDLLQRFMQVRSAGVSPREKGDEKIGGRL
ncbi:MAG TPA: hypothetical protein VI457_03330 [Methylococcaceae bacterium]|nr:hypothetical protein [Methylococcaceae bacterium]